MEAAATIKEPAVVPAEKVDRTGRSRLVSNVQTTRPSDVEWARRPPSFEGEKTIPGIAVTAEN